MKKGRMKWYVFGTLVITILSLLFCYCKYSKIEDFLNSEVVACIFSNLVVILLFLFTYYKIDSNNLKKEQNKQEIANQLLNKAYKAMKDELEKYQKGDYQSSYYSNLRSLANSSKDNSIITEFIKAQKDIPLKYYDDIFALAQDGIITSKEYCFYIDIVNDWKSIVDRYYTKYWAGGRDSLFKETAQRHFTSVKQDIDRVLTTISTLIDNDESKEKTDKKKG